MAIKTTPLTRRRRRGSAIDRPTDPWQSRGKARRLIPLAAALLLAALVAIPASNLALAQAPPAGGIVLVNADRDFVERKKGGEFVARPVFDREIANLFYAVRDADTGDWISAMYRIKGGGEEAQ